MLDFATIDIVIDPKGFGGVVLRAANQNQLIAGGNHTIMDMTPPYEYGTINYNLKFIGKKGALRAPFGVFTGYTAR